MFNSLLERLAIELDKRTIPYMVIGGQAVLRYGEPRLTRDIDIVVGANVAKLPVLLEAVGSCELRVLVNNPVDFVASTNVLPCAHDSSGIRVDVVFGFSGFESDAIQRSNSFQIGNANVRFASPEDIVIMKTIAGRPRDLDDARSIVLKNPSLDMVMIREVLAQFEKVLAQSLLSRLENIVKGSRSANS